MQQTEKEFLDAMTAACRDGGYEFTSFAAGVLYGMKYALEHADIFKTEPEKIIIM